MKDDGEERRARPPKAHAGDGAPGEGKAEAARLTPRELIDLGRTPPRRAGGVQALGAFAILGLGLAGFGLVGALIGGGLLPLSAGRGRPPRLADGGEALLATGLGALGLVAGLWLLGLAAADLRTLLRLGAAARAEPEAPWRWDFAWDQRLATRISEQLRTGLTCSVVGAGLVAPFHWLAWSAEHGGTAGRVAVSAAEAVLALGVAHQAYLLARRVRFAGGEVRLPRFPCWLGEPLELDVRLPPLLRLRDPLAVTLRLVREGDAPGDGRASSVPVELWADTHRFTAAEARGGRFTVTFHPPAGAPATDLHRSVLVYWELDLRASVPGIDYRARYLVPLYDRPE